MKKIPLLFACIFLMARLAVAAGSPTPGVTVAGGNGQGAAANQLNNPSGVFVDAAGNIYVADQSNHRIQKWAPGTSPGVTVAGGNGQGSAANQLSNPGDVFVDAAGNIYINDAGNYRVQKWVPGASTGVTVAGGNGSGTAANQLSNPTDIVVDKTGNIYVADYGTSRITKWAPGATVGVTVAGGNGQGLAANQIAPFGVAVDTAGNIYVVDGYSCRIQEWAPGATSGITVAGGSCGSQYSGQLLPTDVFVDASANIYVADQSGRIRKYPAGSSSGITVAGGNSYVREPSAGELSSPSGVFVDATGNIYVADQGNHRIRKFGVPVDSPNGIIVAGGHGKGTAPNQISTIAEVFADAAGNVYVVGNGIQKWAPGATAGVTVVPNTGSYFFVDAAGNIYTADYANARIQKWTPGAVTGVTVAGGNGSGAAASQLNNPGYLIVDASGNIYINDAGNARIQKWAPGATAGTTVVVLPATTPQNFAVDPAGNIFVLSENSLTKFAPGATKGDTVLGPYNLLVAKSIFIDATGNMYLAESFSEGIRKFAPGSSISTIVASDKIAFPQDVFVDGAGNIYVADIGAFAESPMDTTLYRVLKFSGTGLTYKFYRGDWNALPDFNTLAPVKTSTSANVDISQRPAGVEEQFAFLWQGYIKIKTPGAYTFETVSDDGSRLYFNSSYSAAATPLVNNDGLHGFVPATGSVNVAAAGLYPITITYFNKTGGKGISVFWSGPGFSRQLIPDEAFAEKFTDVIAPGVPANLTAVSVGSNFVNLDWDDATDNAGVAGYDVYVNGAKQYTNPGSAVTVNNLTAATSYSFTVAAFDAAGNRSAASAPLTVTTAGSSPGGLQYKVYQGNWNVLPDFSAITPVKTGNSANVDISLRPAGVDELFGMLWQGTINIKTPGSYTFSTVSDDGSRLYFNAPYAFGATPLVNNDGLHGFIQASGSVNIPAAGNYPIAITYFNKTGGRGISVYWSGPGFSQQQIPDAAFVAAATDTIAPSVPVNLRTVSVDSTFINLDWDDATDNTAVTGYDVYVNGIKRYTTAVSAVTADQLTANTPYNFTVVAFDGAGNRSAASTPVMASTIPANQKGLIYTYYEGDWNKLPNFKTEQLLMFGTRPNVDLFVRKAGVEEHFGMTWEGYINIKTPGNYTFSTVSDDGSRLYFNTAYDVAATPLVDNDGLHGFILASGSVNIPQPGLYPIFITYFNKTGGKGISVYWSGPGFSQRQIPDSVLFKPRFASFAGSGVATATAGRNLAIEEAGKAKTEVRKVYPVPFNDRLNLDFYNSASANAITITLRDVNGRPVYTHRAANLATGNQTLTLPLSGTPLANGMYLVTIAVNGTVVKTMPVLKAKQ